MLLLVSCTTTKTVQTDQKSDVKKSESTQTDVKKTTDQDTKIQANTKSRTKVTEYIELDAPDSETAKANGLPPVLKAGQGSNPSKAKIWRTTETVTETNTDTKKEENQVIVVDTESSKDEKSKTAEAIKTETETTDFWKSVSAYFIAGGVVLAIGLFGFFWFKFKAGLPWMF